MTKAELKNIEKGKIYQAIYRDIQNQLIMFRVKDITDAGTKTKKYIETFGNKYVDLRKRKIKNTHCLNWLGVLDISKIKNLEELKTV